MSNDNATFHLVPQPIEVIAGDGVFPLDAKTPIVTSGGGPALQKVAQYLQTLLFKHPGEIRPGENASGRSITLQEDPNLPLGIEGYTLEVTPTGVLIKGKSAHGVFNGIQTFRQLLPPDAETADGIKECLIPTLTIRDEPRFSWRGAMLDVGRHLFPVEKIKRFLDLMAFHKLNVFHWHLAEDQGWRIQIKKYPKLTEVGAWRNDPTSSSQVYGGFYTRDEIREIVAYAADRFITVVPEIELPGHCSAAITAYPEFGNYDVPNFAPRVEEVRPEGGIHFYTYSPREETFRFLEDVFTEVMDLFPGPFIHIGGDEAPKDQWKESPFAQQVIQREGLADEEELQSWFIRRIEAFLNANGRRLIGWDEIQEGGLSPTASMMIWRDWKWARHAIERGNSVVMSPTSHCYLDYDQESKLPLEKVCTLEPLPPGLTPEQEKLVLGVQENLWTERMPDFDRVEYMAFPRLCAIAETGWSRAGARNYADFSKRLATHLRRLDALEVNYYKPGAIGGVKSL